MRTLHLLTTALGAQREPFELEVLVEPVEAGRRGTAAAWAGFLVIEGIVAQGEHDARIVIGQLDCLVGGADAGRVLAVHDPQLQRPTAVAEEDLVRDNRRMHALDQIPLRVAVFKGAVSANSFVAFAFLPRKSAVGDAAHPMCRSCPPHFPLIFEARDKLGRVFAKRVYLTDHGLVF